jgi:hypothetical protein
MVDVAGKKLKLAIWDTGTARHGLSLPTLAAATASIQHLLNFLLELVLSLRI